MKQIAVPVVGSMAYHKKGLTPRMVTKVDLDENQVWLYLIDKELAGPFDAKNYTYYVFSNESVEVTRLLCPGQEYTGTHHLLPTKVPGMKDAQHMVCVYCKKSEAWLRREASEYAAHLDT